MALILGGVLVGVGAAYQSGWTALAGGVLIFASLICGTTMVPMVVAAKIDGNLVWVKGAREPFLATLPTWNGPL
jgi:hypothetical protein